MYNSLKGNDVKRTDQKGFSAVEGLLIVLVVAAIAFIGWSVMQKQNDQKNKQTTTGSTSGSSDDINKAGAASSTYCAKNEKVCFDHPADWRIQEKETARAGADAVIKADAFTISNTSGAPVLSFDSSYNQLGGACADEDIADQVVISSEPTKINGSYLSKDNEQYALGTVSLLKVVSNQGGRYYANVYLSTDKEFVDQTTVKSCGLFFSPLFKARNSVVVLDGVTTPTSMQFIATSAGFDSRQQAENALESADMQQAYKVLQSVRYE